MFVRSGVLYAYFSKLEFMRTVTNGKAEDHTVYSVSLPFIFVTYILLTGVQVILGIHDLGNPIVLLVIMSIVIYLTKFLCRHDSYFTTVEERYREMPPESRKKVKVAVYTVDLISFSLLCLSIYILKNGYMT